jgi:hypothetical protein
MYDCDVCGKLVSDEDIVFDVYWKPAEKYSDCMRQTTVCSDACLHNLASSPHMYMEIQYK